MKNFKVNLEDRWQLGVVATKSLGRGRLRKGQKRKIMGQLGPKSLPEKFYLKVANLKESEIPQFIRDYQVTLSDSNRATKENILAFQKELREIIDGIEKFKEIKTVKLAQTHQLVYKKTNNLPGIVNKYLKNCYLQLDLPPILPRPLTEQELESYRNQITDFSPESSGLLKDNVFIRTGRGINFANLICRCNSLLSWCVLDLVIDLLVREELTRSCQNCERLFEAKDQRALYCNDQTCQIDRSLKRKRKSRKNS